MSAYTEFVDCNSSYSVLSWEPVPMSGERLNVATLAVYKGKIHTQILIREEVMGCMYGSAGEGILTMIRNILSGLSDVAQEHGLDAAISSIPLTNFSISELRSTWANNSNDLLRQIVLMNCSLGVIADEPMPTADDTPISEREVNQQWAKKVKEAIQVLRPELSQYFNGSAVIVDGGRPVKFAILSPRLVVQFGLLRPAQQNPGMEDARAKLWKLSLAKERNPNLNAALIFGTPPFDDVTLSDKQREAMKSNAMEIQHEAESKQVSFVAAQTVQEAAKAVIEAA